jgi:hypothetical protein
MMARTATADATSAMGGKLTLPRTHKTQSLAGNGLSVCVCFRPIADISAASVAVGRQLDDVDYPESYQRRAGGFRPRSISSLVSR